MLLRETTTYILLCVMHLVALQALPKHNQHCVPGAIMHSTLPMFEARNEPELTYLKPCVHNCMYKQQGQPWNLQIPNAALRHSGIYTGISFSRQGWSHRTLADMWCWWCTCPSLGWKLCTPPGHTLAVPGLCPSQLNLLTVGLDLEESQVLNISIRTSLSQLPTEFPSQASTGK